MPKPTIRLEIFRHDDKLKPEPGQAEPTVRLTPGGRVHATEIGKTRSPEPAVGLAGGSPRQRSGETALRQLLANVPGITPESSLEDIQKLVAENLKVGRKDLVSENLNFSLAGPVGKEYSRHFLETKDCLQFLLNESDQLAEELGDGDSTTYSRAAGNIAELVQRYVQALPRWEQITEEKPDQYAQYGNELQRFFGSHASYVECFLIKVVEKVEGREAAEKFISEALPSKNGFTFSEGYTITIQEMDGEPRLTVRYRDREWTVGPEVIDEMVAERDALNARIAEKTAVS